MQPRPRAAGAAPLPALLAGALAAVLSASCGPGGERPRAAERGAADRVSEIPAEATGPTSRPEVRRDTITVEGTPEPVALRLYRTPPGFPLPFSTYATADLVPEAAPGAPGEAVRFVAAFGGRRTDSAYVEVRVHAGGVGEEAAREALRAAVGGGAAAAPAQQRYPWALAEFSGNTGATVAHGALGRHQGEFFHVLVRYPADFGDGFAPRAAVIVDEWRWEDGTGGLGS